MDALTKLLIVEDSEADQFIAVRRVRRLYPDAEILLAADGQEAIEILGTCRRLPDLILLDINMPRMDGHEFLEHYYRNTSREIPVVLMLTSSDQSEDRDKAARFDCVRKYIVKPIDEKDLRGLPIAV
mgnify:CR=1 FL=1